MMKAAAYVAVSSVVGFAVVAGAHVAFVCPAAHHHHRQGTSLSSRTRRSEYLKPLYYNDNNDDNNSNINLSELRSNKSARERNKIISELGRQQQWRDMLLLYKSEKDKFNNVNYATMMSQLGRIRHLNNQDSLFLNFIDGLASKLETRGIKWMDVRGISNIVHAIGKMKLRSKSSSKVLELVSKKENVDWLMKEGIIKPQEVANIAWAYATLGIKSPYLFDNINDRSEWLVNGAQYPQTVSNTAWSFATLGIKAPMLFSEIEKRSEWLVNDGKPQEIANVAWAFGTLGIRSSKLFAEIDEIASWLLKDGNMKPQEIASTAWSCGVLYIKCTKLFDEIEKQSASLVKECRNTQVIANIALACAKLEIQSPKLFAEIEKRSEWVVKNGTSQEVANVAWAYAKLGINNKSKSRASKLFVEIEKRAEWLILTEGSPEGIANTAWACAKLGFKSEKIFAFIEERADWLVDKGKPQDIAKTAWACAKLGFKLPRVFAKIEERSKWFVKEGKRQEVANVAWACAKLGIESPMLFACIEEHAEWLVDEGSNTQEVSITVWAFAKLGIECPTVLGKIEDRAHWLVKEGSTQDVANTAWACAKLGFQSCPTLFVEIEDRAEWLVNNGKPHEIEKIAWACQQLNIISPNFFALVDESYGWSKKLPQLPNYREDVDNTKKLASIPRLPDANKKLAPIPRLPDVDNKKLASISRLPIYDKKLAPIPRLPNAGGDKKSKSTIALRHSDAPRQQRSRNNVQRNDKAVATNNEISVLGRERKWKEMLMLYKKEKENFNNVNYATTMSQLGKIWGVNRDDPVLHVFVEDLADQMVNRGLSSWMGVRETANIVYNIGKMELRSKASQRIMDLVSTEENAKWLVKNGNMQEVANTAWAFAKLGMKSPSLFHEIENRAQWLVKKGNTHDVSNTVLAFAKLGIKSTKLFAQIEDRAEWLVEKGNAQGVANTAWAFATLGIKSPRLAAEIDKHASRLVQDGNARSVATTVWACAALGIKTPKLVAEIENRAEWFMNAAEWLDGRTRDIASTAWACAKMGIEAPRLFALIEARSEWLVQDGNAQDVANTAYAFALLGIQSSPTLFAEIEEQAEWFVKAANTQNIANTAWAYAKLGIKSQIFFAEVEKRSEWLVNEGKPQEIANVAWACATLGIKCPKLLAAIEKRSEWLAKEGTTQSVANIVWAAGHMKYSTPNLMSDVNMISKRIVNEGNAQDIANIALAFSRVGYEESASFFAYLEEKADHFLQKGNVQEICNTCYSLIILDLGKKHEKLLSAMWEKLIMSDPKDFSNEELNQLSQVEVHAKVDGIELMKPSKALRTKMKGAINTDQPSEELKHISLLLTEFGFNHEVNVSPLIGEGESGGDVLPIDMASRDLRVAIEYDGPSHFLRSVPEGGVTRQPDGPTKAKRRFLKRSSWRVINLDYRDDSFFENIGGGNNRKGRPWRQIRTAPDYDALVDPDLVDRLLQERDKAREEKDFTVADRLLEEARTSPDGNVTLRIYDKSRTWRVWTTELRHKAIEKCIDIVSAHEPEKLEEVKNLLSQFSGREYKILTRLKDRYGAK